MYQDHQATHLPQDVAAHITQKSLWLIIDDKVYDVTQYHRRHPGGAAVMLQMAGKDATAAAQAAHKTSLPDTLMKEFFIGYVANRRQPEEGAIVPNASSTGTVPFSRQCSAASDGVLTSEDALVNVADLLYQELQRDDQIGRFFTNDNLPQLAAVLRSFLSRAFNGGEWPLVRITAEQIHVFIDSLIDALVDALSRPIPLGDDALVAAFDNLSGDMAADERVQRFLSSLQHCVVEEPASSHNIQINRPAIPTNSSTEAGEEPVPEKQA